MVIILDFDLVILTVPKVEFYSFFLPMFKHNAEMFGSIPKISPVILIKK